MTINLCPAPNRKISRDIFSHGASFSWILISRNLLVIGPARTPGFPEMPQGPSEKVNPADAGFHSALQVKMSTLFSKNLQSVFQEWFLLPSKLEACCSKQNSWLTKISGLNICLFTWGPLKMWPGKEASLTLAHPATSSLVAELIFLTWDAGDPSSIPEEKIWVEDGIGYPPQYSRVSRVTQTVENPPAI